MPQTFERLRNWRHQGTVKWGEGQRSWKSIKNKRIALKSLWVAVRDLQKSSFTPHTQANTSLVPWHKIGVYSLRRLNKQGSGRWNMGVSEEGVRHHSKVRGTKSRYVYKLAAPKSFHCGKWSNQEKDLSYSHLEVPGKMATSLLTPNNVWRQNKPYANM